MVRMITLPAPLDRRVQMNGAAVARPAPATKVRREILFVRSVMSWPPAPGGGARCTQLSCLRSRRWDRGWEVTGNTRAFGVSSGPARVDPVLEALPVDDERHDGKPPGMQRDGRDRRQGPAYLRGGGAERAIRENPPHHRGHGHPAAVVAEADVHAGLRLVHVRQMIGGEGHATAPAVLPLRRADLGEDTGRHGLEAREEGGIAGVVE